MNQAACRALEQAKEKNIQKLVLYTDSKFTINGESEAPRGVTLIKVDPRRVTELWAAGVTSWVKNWKLNNWRLKSGGPVTNKEDFVKLDRLNAELEVVWVNIQLCHPESQLFAS